MYSSFFAELEKEGMQVKFTTELTEIEGDVLVTGIGGGWEPHAARAMNIFKGPVILNIYNSYICFNRSFLKHWKSKILFAYNPDYATLNFEKYNSVGIKYYDFPFGSDEKVFFPIDVEKKYDITFIGNADSGFGREKYVKALIDLSKRKNYKFFLAGHGWEKYGYEKRIIKHGSDTNLIYNQSKICVNIHNNRQFAGIDIEMDANNRLFDLAMAQCCQISNGELMVSKYFTKEEVLTADDPEIWISYVDRCIENDQLRHTLANNARTKALNEHTWNARAKEFNNLVNRHFLQYNSNQQKVGFFLKLFRIMDQYIVPMYRIKEIRMIRFILYKTGFYEYK